MSIDFQTVGIVSEVELVYLRSIRIVFDVAQQYLHVHVVDVRFDEQLEVLCEREGGRNTSSQKQLRNQLDTLGTVWETTLSYNSLHHLLLREVIVSDVEVKVLDERHLCLERFLPDFFHTVCGYDHNPAILLLSLPEHEAYHSAGEGSYEVEDQGSLCFLDVRPKPTF